MSPRRLRAIAPTLLSIVAIVVSATPATGHSQYHYTGAQSTVRHDGAQAWINVTNAGARLGTSDFVANRIMGKNANSNVWIEVGWAEVGWLTDSNGFPKKIVYVYETQNPGWRYYNTVTAGGHVDVRIVKASSCAIGDPSCTYHAQLFNHSTGAWQTLHSTTLPMDRLYLEQYTEVYIDPAEPAYHMSIDIPDNSLNWVEVQRRFADGSWAVWNAANTSAGNSSSTYCASWTNNYYKWYAYKGSC